MTNTNPLANNLTEMLQKINGIIKCIETGEGVEMFGIDLNDPEHKKAFDKAKESYKSDEVIQDIKNKMEQLRKMSEQKIPNQPK